MATASSLIRWTGVFLLATCLGWSVPILVVAEGEKVSDLAPTALDVRPCSFQGLTPGRTTVTEALEKLGMPTDDSELNGTRILTFRLEPFEQAEVFISDDVVESIVLHFKAPAAPAQIEHELDLRNVEATPVYSSAGLLLGRAYPERGVLLNFAPNSTSHRATQMVLEPISAELFFLRARNDTRHRYQQRMADLETARRLDPKHRDAILLEAELHGEIGEWETALKLIAYLLETEPIAPHLLVRKAEYLLRLDRREEAFDLVRGIAADGDGGEAGAADTSRARAEKLYGDCLACGASPDYAAALDHHLKAIQKAAPLANDPRLEVRVAAKRLLVEAFLAAGLDIASGQWQDQEATAAKWLAGARELADSLVAQERASEAIRFEVSLASLATEATASARQSLDTLLPTMAKEAQRLKEQSGDEWFARELDLRRARGLFHAAAIAHREQRAGQSRELAQQAIDLMEPWQESRTLSPDERYLVGRLHFFVGSLAAVSRQDHEQAVKSYERARKFLTTQLPASHAGDLARHGERWVSIGASYFEVGKHEDGLRMTREGIELIKEAVAANRADESALALPYNNLAAMYQALGQGDEAREWSELARRTGTLQR